MTLMDVAEQAGVALNTARRALSNHPTVRPYIKERVLKAAQELNYHPNLLARALKENTLQLVPISVQGLEQIYFGTLATHLSRCLVEAGLEPALCFNPEHLLRMSHSLATSGSILVSGFDKSIIRALALRQKVVTVDSRFRPMTNVGNVEVDFETVYRYAVTALLKSGRKRIACCSPYYLHAKAKGWLDPKLTAILDVLTEAGLKLAGPAPEPVFADAEALGAWLDRRRGSVDALFCQNDMMASLAVGVLAARGLRSPDDLLVIGCDNNLVLSGTWSIQVDTAVLAAEAVGLLRRLLGGETRVETQMYKPSLVNDRGEPVEMVR